MNVILAVCMLALQPAALWCRSVEARGPSALPHSSESESESWEAQDAALPAPPAPSPAAPAHRNNIAELLLPLIERGLSAERRPVHTKKVIQVLPIRASKERTSSWPHLNSRKKHVVEITPLRTKGRDGKPLAYILSPAKDSRRTYAKRTDRHHGNHEHKDHSGHYLSKKLGQHPSDSSSEEDSDEVISNIPGKKEEVSLEDEPENSTEEEEPKIISEELNAGDEDKTESISDDPNSDISSGDESRRKTESGGRSDADNSKSSASESNDSKSEGQDSDLDYLNQKSDDVSEPDSKVSSEQFLYPESDSGNIADDKSASENNDLSQSNDSPDNKSSVRTNPSSESQDETEYVSGNNSEEEPTEKPTDKNTEETTDQPSNNQNQPDTSNVSPPNITDIPEELVHQLLRFANDNDDSKQSQGEEILPQQDIPEDSPSRKAEVQPDVIETQEGKDGRFIDDAGTTTQSPLEKDELKNETTPSHHEHGSLEHKYGHGHEEKSHYKAHHERKHYNENSEYIHTKIHNIQKHIDYNLETKPIDTNDKKPDDLSDQAITPTQETTEKTNSNENQTEPSHIGHVDGDSATQPGNTNEYNFGENNQTTNVEETTTEMISTTETSDFIEGKDGQSPLEVENGDNTTEQPVTTDTVDQTRKSVGRSGDESDIGSGDQPIDSGDITLQPETTTDEIVTENIIITTELPQSESTGGCKGKKQPEEGTEGRRAGNDEVIDDKNKLQKPKKVPESKSDKPSAETSLRTADLKNIKKIIKKYLKKKPQPDKVKDDFVIGEPGKLDKYWQPNERDIIELIQSSGEAAPPTPPECDSRRSAKENEHTHKSYRLSFLFNK